MKNSLFYCLTLVLLIGCQPFEKNGYIFIKNQTDYPITDLKVTYISAQKTYSLGTLYPYSEYKYAINYEQHNEDSIIFSYLDKNHKKINQEVATYAAKYDRKSYEIVIRLLAKIKKRSTFCLFFIHIKKSCSTIMST